MSDSDGDWSDDDGEVVSTLPPPPPPPPAASANVDDEAELEPEPAGPTVIFALPIQIALLLPAQSAPAAAGITLLYDASQGSFTLLAYNANKQPVAAEVLDVARCSNWGPLQLGVSMVMSDDLKIEWTTSDKRKWLLTFGDRNSAIRLLAALSIASVCVRARASNGNDADKVSNSQMAIRVNVYKGNGHTFRSGSQGKISLRLYKFAVRNIQRPRNLKTLLDNFQISTTEPGNSPSSPDSNSLISTCEIDDIEIEDEATNSVTTLGQLINKMKEGDERILCIPSESICGAYLLKESNTSSLNDSLLIAHVTAISSQKKKDKKKKEKKSSSSVTPTENSTVQSFPPQEAAVPQPIPFPKASASNENWAAILAASDSLASILPLAEQSLAATAPFQQKSLRQLISEMYDNICKDLALNDNVDPKATETITALQTHMRSVIAGFRQVNGNTEQVGSFTNLASNMKSLIDVLHDNLGGVLSPAALQKLKSQSEKVTSNGPSPKVESLEKKLKDARIDAEVSQKKNAELLSSNKDLKSQLEAIEAERKELSKKLEMMAVFETGIMEMRKMLDKEVEEHRQLQEQHRHLQHTASKLKVTWLPERVVNACMRCNGAFKMFGKTKTYCRFCGRIYCQQCTAACNLPELGYGNEKVRVCLPCVEFRRQHAEDLNVTVDADDAASSGSKPPKQATSASTLFDDDD